MTTLPDPLAAFRLGVEVLAAFGRVMFTLILRRGWRTPSDLFNSRGVCRKYLHAEGGSSPVS